MRRTVCSQRSFAFRNRAVPSCLVCCIGVDCVDVVFEARLQSKGLGATWNIAFEWTGVLLEVPTVWLRQC